VAETSAKSTSPLAALLWVVLLVVGLSALVTGRAVFDGERALSACDEALRSKDRPTATARAREAAAWYAPGAPHVAAAYARLVHIARTAEAENDRDGALLAWRSVRSAILDSAFLVPTHDLELAAANRAIARLSAAEPGPSPVVTEEPDAAERRLEILLSRREQARAPYVALVFVGLLAVLGGAARLLRLEPAQRRTSPALLFVAAGFFVYLIAVWLA
jgi:hypothetical protein